jgi:hypothetical protein
MDGRVLTFMSGLGQQTDCPYSFCDPHSLLCGHAEGPQHDRISNVKFTLEQSMKAQRESRCIDLLFLQPRRCMGVGGQRHTPAALLPGKTPYPLYRKLGGPQVRSGRVRKISPPTGIRSPDRPARSQSLYRQVQRKLSHLSLM